MKYVEIIIKGLHCDGTDTADMCICAKGTHYHKNDKHYICYDETDMETGETSGSILKIGENYVELMKRGAGATHLLFENGKRNNTYLQTVMGRIFIGVDTKCIHIIEETDRILATIEYALLVEEEKVSDCTVEILIQSIQE